MDTGRRSGGRLEVEEQPANRGGVSGQKPLAPRLNTEVAPEPLPDILASADTDDDEEEEGEGAERGDDEELGRGGRRRARRPEGCGRMSFAQKFSLASLFYDSRGLEDGHSTPPRDGKRDTPPQSHRVPVPGAKQPPTDNQIGADPSSPSSSSSSSSSGLQGALLSEAAGRQLASPRRR
ncbi:hypothetical protein EYF80_059975 [Liparis tanakae]|uniref:Uncharacterized protein n=1 Tax=Liparis tanakae TaxID=230148 RepID=A0A4Z2EM84_9TELE|nr:hypothetical protein EYF80_059975 [Liparis tanakae]